MFANTINKNVFTANHTIVINRVASQYDYEPLTTGDIAPSFNLPAQHSFFGTGISNLGKDTHISLQDFIDYQQPLVVLFLGAASRAVLQTKKLERLHDRIRKQGGRLLVLTPLEQKHIKRQLKNSSLPVFQDEDNEIAEAFGLYDEQNPLWQWVSGIDEEEATLPALYVIAPDRSITYHFIDFDFLLYNKENFDTLPFIGDLLEEVNSVSLQYHPQQEYRLVS